MIEIILLNAIPATFIVLALSLVCSLPARLRRAEPVLVPADRWHDRSASRQFTRTSADDARDAA